MLQGRYSSRHSERLGPRRRWRRVLRDAHLGAHVGALLARQVRRLLHTRCLCPDEIIPVMLRFQNHVNFPFRWHQVKLEIDFFFFFPLSSIGPRWLSKLIIRPITWFTMYLWLPQYYHNLSEAWPLPFYHFVRYYHKPSYLYQETRSR